MNEKYVVFKSEDIDRLLASGTEDGMFDIRSARAFVDEHALPDAEVIRKQDILAGPVLHAYAGQVETYLGAMRYMAEEPGLLRPDLHAKTIERLEQIRDHFHVAAVEADEWPKKKVPD